MHRLVFLIKPLLLIMIIFLPTANENMTFKIWLLLQINKKNPEMWT